MPRRGPYKQYDTDTSIEVPRSTLHDRRKRCFAEVDAENSEHEEVRPITAEEFIDDEQYQVSAFVYRSFVICKNSSNKACHLSLCQSLIVK